MNDIKIFENKEFGKVRTVIIDNEIWFVGRDIAEALGYSRPNEAISTHCRCTLKHRIGVETGKKADGSPILQEVEMLVIPERDVYRLIMRSKLPSAERFEEWVVGEVLPSIRKTGSYSLNIPKTLPEALRAFADEVEAHEKTKAALAIAAPKAEFYDTVASSESLTSFADTAKLLDKGIGRNKLMKLLREKKILQKDNIPYQTYVDRGYFKVVESCYMANENKVVSYTTYVKQKGIDYIRKLLV